MVTSRTLEGRGVGKEQSKLILLCKILAYLLKFLEQAIWYQVHHYQWLVVPVELAAIVFIFQLLELTGK